MQCKYTLFSYCPNSQVELLFVDFIIKDFFLANIARIMDYHTLTDVNFIFLSSKVVKIFTGLPLSSNFKGAIKIGRAKRSLS